MKPLSNARLYVDRSALRENAKAAMQTLSGAKLIPVLKADAYGLGLIPVAEALSDLPEVCCFAVAQVQEGVQLRKAGVQQEILVLDEALPQQLDAAVAHRLTLTVGRVSDLAVLAARGRATGQKVAVQIKFDTGLHRIGISEESFDALLHALPEALGKIALTGAYSHFADPDDAPRCAAQYLAFVSLCKRLEAAGIRVPLRHICDSAASEQYPAYALDAVRLGRRLGWAAPGESSASQREAATLRAVVTDVRLRRAGDRLGYGTGMVLSRDAQIASLGIGYGDGLDPRMAERGLPVLICGKRCRMLVCFMDRTLVDVTGVPVAIGDEATLFGYDASGELLSAQEQALSCGANESCGLTTMLLPRVERVYS